MDLMFLCKYVWLLLLLSNKMDATFIVLFLHYKNFKKWNGECYSVWPPLFNVAAKCHGFCMCVHRRNVGCTCRPNPYILVPRCTWCMETIHRVSSLDVQCMSLLTNCSTILGKPRVYGLYFYSFNSLFNSV